MDKRKKRSHIVQVALNFDEPMGVNEATKAARQILLRVWEGVECERRDGVLLNHVKVTRVTRLP